MHSQEDKVMNDDMFGQKYVPDVILNCDMLHSLQYLDSLSNNNIICLQ